MSALPAYFPPFPSTPLYHYTGLDTLFNIVSTREIRASSVHYMNDALEINHACAQMQELMRPYIAFGSATANGEIATQFSQWLERVPDDTSRTVCVFSLSEEPNSLSQWRSYTPHGKGVRIEFNGSEFNQNTVNQKFVIGKCIYTQQEQSDYMSAVFQYVCQLARDGRISEGAQGEPLYSYVHIFDKHASDFYQLLALIKHPSFSEEKEWRIISTLKTDHEGCELRMGKSMLIPYVTLSLPDTGMFKSVMLGPSEHTKLSVASLRSYLRNHCNYVDHTDIPYREW